MKKSIFVYVITITLLVSATSLADGEFDEAMNNVAILKPEQIEKILRDEEDRKKVIIGKPANVIMRSITLNMEPGAKPQKIITLPAYSTSIAFFDRTGAVWSIKKVKSGNPGAFHVEQPDKKEKSNILTVSCISDAGHSNLTIELLGLDVPIMFPIVIAPSYKKKVPTIDGVVLARIDQFGPNAKPPVLEPGPQDPVTDEMLSYLDGISPDKNEILTIEPINRSMQAWRSGEKIYLRTTQGALIWPAWQAAVRGSGETRVYEIPKNVISILFSSNGRIERYTLKNKKQ